MDIINILGVFILAVLLIVTGIVGAIIGYNSCAKEYEKYKILAEAFDEFQEFIEK